METIKAWIASHPDATTYLGAAAFLLFAGLRIRDLARKWQAPMPEAQRHALATAKGPRIEELPPFGRLVRGTRIGLIMPGIFSLLILALLVFGGRYQPDKYGKPQDMLVMFVGYLVGSAFLGAIMRFFTPWIRRLPVAIGAGWLAGVPMTIGIVAAEDNNLTQWSDQTTKMCIALSLLLGAILGIAWRHAYRRIDAARLSDATLTARPHDSPGDSSARRAGRISR